MDMAEFRSVKTAVKLTAMAGDHCCCCYSAQNLQKLSSPALDVYLSICNYQGLKNDDIHVKTCLRCSEFLKEVHEFKMKRTAIDENLCNNRDVKYCDIESTLKNAIEGNSSQLKIKTEVIDEYSEFDEINSEHENAQSITETFPKCPLDSIKPENDNQLHVSVNSDVGNLLIESYDIKQDHILESNDTIAQQVLHSKRRLIIPIERCDISNSTSVMAVDDELKTVIKSAKHCTKLRSNLKASKSAIHPINAKFFECNKCSYKTTHKNDLRDHVRRKHSDENVFLKCNECSYTTRIKGDLKGHIRRKHSDEKVFLKCNECSYTTRFKADLKGHFDRNHSEGRAFSCDQCNNRYKVKLDLMKHKRKFHPKVVYEPHSDHSKLFECNKCSYKTTRKDHLKGHIVRKHSEEKVFLKCSECSYTTRFKRDLNIHFGRKHSEERPFSCDQCDNSFKVKPDLMNHKRNFHLNVFYESHSGRSKLFECNECSYKTTRKIDLRIHTARKHFDEKPFSCDQCNKHFKVKPSLLQHKREVHSDKTAGEFFKCNECSYITVYKRNLRNHTVRKHCEERPFSCDQCNQHFKLAGDLVYHKRKVHQDIAAGKFFECNECSHKTTRKIDLIEHIEHKHLNKKVLSCDQCNIHFKLKRDLMWHERRVHQAAVKSLKCNLCSYVTAYKNYLSIHIARKHCDEKPFSCNQCNKHFKVKQDLQYHKRKVHLDKAAGKFLADENIPTKEDELDLNDEIRFK